MNKQDHAALVESIANDVEAANRIAFFTGAGLSAESGLPTYRGVGGLYNDMTVDEGLPIEAVLSGAMFRRSPGITWKYISEVERACRGAEANRAHRIIAELESVAEVWVITQNVDGFHLDAGSSHVLELHGNLRKLSCTSCGLEQRVADYHGLEIPPRCSRCQSLVRPDVVLFGELLPEQATSSYEREMARGFDVLFSIGTSAGFPYVYQPVMDAAERGLPTIEVNPDETILSKLVRYRMDCGAVSALSQLRDELKRRGLLS